jgi:PAS domain S-box-containing protein
MPMKIEQAPARPLSESVSLAVLVAVMGVGVGVIAGWHFHIRALVQVLPGVISMQYNTALCFFALGASAWALVARRGQPLVTVLGGGLVALMGVLVIFQYATGTALGVDTLFFYPWDRTLSADPGRMALTSAMSFTAAGLALALLALRPSALAFFALAHTLPLSLGAASLLGYLLGITYVLPFKFGSQMAVHTALAFFAYGGAMLGHAWRRTPPTGAGLPPWSPVVAVMIVPVLFVALSAVNASETALAQGVKLALALLSAALLGLAIHRLADFKIAYKGLILVSTPLAFVLAFVVLVTGMKRGSEQAQAWSLHSKEVLAQSHALLGQLLDAESGVRGYVITGNPDFAAPYEGARRDLQATVSRLQQLVRDNPERAARAGRLTDKAAERLAALGEVLGLARAGAGAEAVERVKSGYGKHLMDEFRRELAAFLGEEERLDTERQLKVEASWQRFNWLLAGGASVAVLLTLFLALLFSRGISGRLSLLTANARRFAEGQELAPARGGADEIAELERVFHQMAKTIGEAARKERAIIEHAQDVICTIDAEGRFVKVSPACRRVWGYAPEELAGRRYIELVAPEDVEKTNRAAGEIVAGRNLTDFENRYRHQDGSLVNVMWSASWSPADGLMFCVARDITERKRAEEALRRAHDELEERVRERTADLLRANAELQDFAYVASHDLQEPLRKIQAFGDRLRAKCGAALTDQGRDYLSRMQQAAARMQTLINDLLSFSRVTTKAQPFSPVNLAEVAREVVSDLEARIEQTGGRVEAGELPEVEADATQMRQLLQNLIGNALKFHRDGEPPRVRVTARLTNGHAGGPALCLLAVEDNGIGFEEKYLDRIFTPFQRLHGRGEYEGTGIGLAICRKIVERHGGQITARSAPGAGTTFVVTLPARQPKGGMQ